MAKALGVIIGVLVLLAGGWALLGGSNDASAPSNENKQTKANLTFASIQKDIENGAQLLDVRTPEEYDEGHFTESTLLPLQVIESGKMPEVNKDTKLYVYCRSGNRSADATKMLKNAGYTDVVDLGGLADVQKLGGSLQTK